MQLLVKKKTDNKRQELIGIFNSSTLFSLVDQLTKAGAIPEQCLFAHLPDSFIGLNGRVRSNGKVYIAQSYFCDDLIKVSNSDNWMNNFELIEYLKEKV